MQKTKLRPGQRMIDLVPLAQNCSATDVILLARGQLNRTFRSHGMFAPDPLAIEIIGDLEPTEVDDPAGCGLSPVLHQHPMAFKEWASSVPELLVPSLLAILGNTLARLTIKPEKNHPAREPIEQACDYLLARLPRPPGLPAS